MADSLVPKKLEAKIKKLLKAKAKINEKGASLEKDFDSYCDANTINEAFECISKNGQPKHIITANELRQKYDAGEFYIDDMYKLIGLYKLRGRGADNKEIEND